MSNIYFLHVLDKSVGKNSFGVTGYFINAQVFKFRFLDICIYVYYVCIIMHEPTINKFSFIHSFTRIPLSQEDQGI